VQTNYEGKKIIHVFNENEGPQTEFYNEQKEKNIDDRKNAILNEHRTFSNWIKSILIQKYSNLVKEYYHSEREMMGEDEMDDELPADQNFPMSVLEMACGKGGDLRKWQEAKIQNYVGIDISNVSLQRAAARFMGFQGLSFCSLFIEGDGATDPQEFFKDFQDDMYFDIVSCQMA
jgi:mRNA (guanine-N7-)-methyltransferase